MESYLDADNSEGQFKVTRGHSRSNGLPILFYGHGTWWMESSYDAKHKRQFKVTRGHPRLSYNPITTKHKKSRKREILIARFRDEIQI